MQKGNRIKKYNIGLVIGRFQPFHLGHYYLIEQALKYCEKLIIGIGSSNVVNEDNPYTTKMREEFIKEFIKREKLGKRIIKFVNIPDVPNDDEWFKIAEKLTGKIDVVIGDNKWVNGIYSSHKIPVIEIGYHKRDMLEGVKIRRRIKESKVWKDRVPEYIHKLIEK